jgi:tetratricopeptide (TPR) repeat protein
MVMHVLFEDIPLETGDDEIRTWSEPYPPRLQKRPLTADDTIENPSPLDAPPAERRASEGPRRKLALTLHAIRDAVAQRYEEEGAWEALAQLYRSRIEIASHDSERVELYKRVADIVARELADPGGAFDALLAAFWLNPQDDETTLALEESARRADRWKLLAREVRDALADSHDRARQVRYAELLARWHRVELADPQGAEPYLERIRTLDPGNALAQRRLAIASRDVGAWDAQREALAKALTGAKTVVERSSAHVSMADLYEQRLRDVTRAREHYQAALALDPSSMDALRGLERVARVVEDWGSLARAIDMQVDAAANDDDRIAALLRLADVHERQFVRPQSAAPKLELVLVFDPTNDEAHEGLERCYRAMRAWPELGSTLERRARLTVNPLEQCDTLMRAAAVKEEKLEDLGAALETYQRVYAIDDGHVAAIKELTRLSEKRNDFSGAAAYKARLAELTSDARARAQIHAQIGEMLAPDDRDPACARLHFEKAVSFDPQSSDAWEGLQGLAGRAADPMFTVFCLERRAEQTESPRLKAQILVELAEAKGRLGDARGGFSTHEYAIEVDPSNEAAARAVLEPWIEARRWDDASPVCELLLNAASRDGDLDRGFYLLCLAARIAGALGHHERALVAAQAAFEARPDDTSAVVAFVDTVYRLREDEDVRFRARPWIERVAADPTELSADTLVKVGALLRLDHDDENAIPLFCDALQLESEHAGALRALAEAFGARGDWKRACDCLHRLALATEDRRARFAILVETADAWEQQAHCRSRAASALEEALAVRPGDSRALHRLVVLYGDLGAWERMVSTLRLIAQGAPDDEKRAKSLFAAAGVVREKLGDGRRAARFYEEVLDLDTTRLDAFERIVQIHIELRDWNELRIAYSRMIARVPEGANVELLHALYHQVGLVYRDRIGDAARALEAFRAASALAPDSVTDRKIVIELHVVMERVDLAIATSRAAQKREPERLEAYRELYDLFLRDHAPDKAWCAADVLAHLGTADAGQQKLLIAYRPCEVSCVAGTLAATAWSSHVLHPALDTRVTAIFRIVAPAILRMRLAAIPARDRTSWLGRPLRAEDSPGVARLAALVENVAEILSVPPPVLYARPTMPMPLAIAPAPGPALFVALDAVDAIPTELLPYVVAQRIAELRPELAAHALFPTVSELKALLKAAIRTAVAPASGEGVRPPERALAKALGARELEALRVAVSTVVDVAREVDLRRWLELADASLARVGMLVLGSFDATWRAHQGLARAPGDMEVAEWRREALAFAVSDEYADLRGAIGVSLDAPGG